MFNLLQVSSVTIRWIHPPSHGGAYMVEGHLLLGLDWLVVVQSLAPSYVATHCTSTLYLHIFSRVSGFRVAPYLVIVVIVLCCASQYCLHGILYPMMDLSRLRTDGLVC